MVVYEREPKERHYKYQHANTQGGSRLVFKKRLQSTKSENKRRRHAPKGPPIIINSGSDEKKIEHDPFQKLQDDVLRNATSNNMLEGARAQRGNTPRETYEKRRIYIERAKSDSGDDNEIECLHHRVFEARDNPRGDGV